MSRRNDSLDIMIQVRSRLISEGITDPAVIAKAIDDAYPFGARKHWPYKAWLAARKEFFIKHGLPGLRLAKDGKQASLIPEQNNNH